MRMRHASRAAVVLALAAAVVTIQGCNDAEDPTAPVPSALLGSWVATSVMVQGTDLVTQGMVLSFHFSADGEYSYLVTGDLLDLCDQGSDCSDWGEFTASSTQITFDPGSGAQIMTYSISGDVMTMTGSMGGTSIQATFERT